MHSDNNSLSIEWPQGFHCLVDFNGPIGVYIFNSIVLVLTSIPATLGNLLVLVSIWRTPSLHSPSNVLLFGLAVSDLGVDLFAEPIFTVYNIAKLKGLAHVFCNSVIARSIACSLLCFTSLLTITAISLDMYIALHLHLRYKEIVTVKKVTAVLAGIWVCGITLSLSYLWYWNTLWILWVFLNLLCLLVSMSAYYKVLGLCRYHQARLYAQAQIRKGVEDKNEGLSSIAKHRKSLMSKIFIYCLFVLCFLPSVATTVVVQSTSFSAIKQTLYEVSLVVVYMNSTLNPYVYCWRFRKIRVAVIKTIRKILRTTKCSH